MSDKTALVVDDSKSARFALRKYLENHGYKVETADGASEAYGILQRQRPQVIFMDHVMPEIDGFMALKHIKETPASAMVPVVICSSNESQEFHKEALALGAIEVLTKPPRAEHLAQIVDDLQNGKHATPELTADDFDLAVELPPLAAQPAAPAPGISAMSIPPAAPSKVANIREPEVAIEQAVMKVLRGAMQPPRAEAPAAPAAAATKHTPVPPPAEFNPAATGSFNAAQTRAATDTTHVSLLRDQMESRLKKLTQDFFVQIAELKSTVSHLEGRDSGATPETMQQIADAMASGVHQRIDAMEHAVNARLSEFRTQMEARMAEQAERIAQITQAARAAAAEEAHAASERTMMSAASRIAEQLANSILKAQSSEPALKRGS